MMIKTLDECRICRNKNLVPILDLGEQVLTGVFPKSSSERITRGPLALVKCDDVHDPKACGLLQLKHSYALEEMYGENYGYRSGLNSSMVEHLRHRVTKILERVDFSSGDLVIDIGSNDSTLLRQYPQNKGLTLCGIDPTGVKFKSYYPQSIDLIPHFFSVETFKRKFSTRKARVISSIAMFYDLESPLDFMRQIHEVLDEEGIWVFEQSYMPTMLEKDSYDTVCHEHLEYYALKQIQWMANAVGFKIVDIEFNAANGGSFAITVAKKTSKRHKENSALVDDILNQEKHKGLNSLSTFEAFQKRVDRQRQDLINFVKGVNAKGQKIFGYGASTKGNVILQYCGFTSKDIECVAEVNPDKFGRFTPGTNIPIVSEAQAKNQKPDFLLVLPWHFKDNIIAREQQYIQDGGALVFPLPEIEVVDQSYLAAKRP